MNAYIFLFLSMAIISLDAASMYVVLPKSKAPLRQYSSTNKHPPTYNDMWPAEKKGEVYWKEIQESRYAPNELPPMTGPGLAVLVRMLNPFLVAYNAYSSHRLFKNDGEKKAIHTSGIMAKASFEPINNTGALTGIFHSGAPHVLLRLSLATPPNDYGCVPGLACKFLIEGQPDVNILAMNSTQAQEGHNIFMKSFSTILPESPWTLSGAIIKLVFKMALKTLKQEGSIRALSLVELASIEDDGTKISNPKIPYEMLFEPTQHAYNLLDGITSKDDFRARLMQAEPGQINDMILYYVKIRLAQSETPFLIGYLKINSEFTASRFGDEYISFRHPPMMSHHE